MEITAEFIEAKRLIYDTDAPFIYISGGAGTGKSFFINNLLDHSETTAFIAPTGLSARNIKGKTIHSFFGFSTATPVACQATLNSLNYTGRKYDFLKRLEILVIDEISMVRSDMLDLICAALMIARGNTLLFGGVKIVAVGDLYQLPPVVDTKKHPELGKVFSSDPKDVAPWKRWKSSWFFDAQCLKECDITYVEFTKQFRQASDAVYADHLNQIRSGFSDKALAYFNRAQKSLVDKNVPRIFNRKKPALDYNRNMLKHLPGEAVVYEAEVEGIFWEYNETDLPAPRRLELKPGASVMFVKNSNYWKNGTLGIVVSLDRDSAVVRNLDDQQDYPVYPETWDEYSLNDDKFCIGLYKQLPLTLAWAFNVHKMQGLTFDRIVYNPSGWNLPGMVYVALSRTRSLEGLYLEAPLNADNIRQDGLVQEFYNNLLPVKKTISKLLPT